MNDKIKQLAVEAGLVDFVGEIMTKKTEELKVEKFAELIVRECAIVGEKYAGASDVGKVIKEHFGVEE